MPHSILVPMHLEAKVLTSATKVPMLDGNPFNEGGTLEKGVHLHWALPDALTRARFLDTPSGKRTLFPGVPDLWLVVRFNPVPVSRPSTTPVKTATPTRATTKTPAVTSTPTRKLATRVTAKTVASSTTAERASAASASADNIALQTVATKRSWRAWVVDSRSGTVTPLDSWNAPSPGPDSVLTFAGLLPSAASLGAPGWGIYNTAQGTFNPAVAAYYPNARQRFGFHDSLADLGTSAGPVSYAVVGWFASQVHDPLYGAPDRKEQLKAWKFIWKDRHSLKRLPTAVAIEAAAASRFVSRTTKAASVPTHRVAEAAAMIKRAGIGAEGERQDRRMLAMKRSIGELAAAVGTPMTESGVHMEVLVGAAAPSEIVCHGTVTEVPLKPPATAAPTFQHDDVRVYPTVKTAMAAIASLDELESVDMVEALLQEVDGQMAKTQGGVIDLPAALHGLSFQSAPGRSQYFAQLLVTAPRLLRKTPKVSIAKAVSTTPVASTRVASGHWPALTTRAAGVTTMEASAASASIKDFLKRTPKTAKPYEPTPAEVNAWIADVEAALEDAAAEAAAKGTPIDPTVLRVVDRRKRAQPALLGPSADGRTGSDGSSYWIDVQDEDAMRRLLIAVHGATVGLPDADKLHEVPGPRWYRPWSPQVVVKNQGRSFRFGEDGRFEQTGKLRCRVSGETLSSIKAGTGKTVPASSIVQSTLPISGHTGVPPEARAIVDESALLDAGNARDMARLSQAAGASATVLNTAAGAFEDTCHAILLLRDPSLTAAHREQILTAVSGKAPSPVAFLSWHDPWDPIFVDVNYAHPYSSLQTNWTLEGEEGKPPSVEFRPLSGAATVPPAGQVEVIEERTFLTSTIVHTLESSLVTKITLDKYGNPIHQNSPPSGYDEDSFKEMAVLSAPLTGFDETVMARGRRERSGGIRLNTVDIIDSFGTRRRWSSLAPASPQPASPHGSEDLPWWCALSPRFPFWSRLQFRLMSATNAGEEATFKDSPICGFLLPDLLEHALEVYDAEGRALGQLRSDPPQRGSKQAKTLDAWFEVHPWTAAELNMTPGENPLNAIANPRLRKLVEGVAAQGGVAIPPNQPKSSFFETGVTALLRIIDTLKPAIDPKLKLKDRKVRLVGDPIAVLAAGVWLEATAQDAPEALAGDPTPLAQPPAVPTLTVRIGDQSRPDDGVFGCFLPHVNPAQSRFAPVDAEVAEKAVLNELPTGGISKMAVTHPFVAGLECAFPLGLGGSLDLTVLVEAGAGLHAVCGVLPRKKVVPPREFLAGAERLEPTFRVGPLLSIPSPGSFNPILPVPSVEGHEVEWVRFEPGEEGEPDEWLSNRVPPLPPVGAVPPGRAGVSQGWMRLVRKKEPPA